ncbi:MAG: hypothetical protein V4556_04555 [Bacteroidota bacterium]
MKNISIVLVFMITFISGCTEKRSVKNDLQLDELKGKVRSVKTVYHNAAEKFGEITATDLKERGIEFTYYNEKGFRTALNSYDAEGNAEEKIFYKYDEKNNLIEKITSNAEGGLENKVVYKYDENGNLSEQNIYGPDGKLDKKIIAKNDKKGNALEEAFYKENGSVDKKIIYKNDNNGNPLDHIAYKPSGAVDYAYRSKYNGKGQVTETIDSTQESVYKVQHKYDEAGLVTETNTFSNGEKDVFYKFKYEFDKNKNWKKAIVFENEIPSGITERIIEYY